MQNCRPKIILYVSCIKFLGSCMYRNTRYTKHDVFVYRVLNSVLYVCPHFRGLTSQRAAQCNGILISILVFPIKPHYMKLLFNASTQIQLSYLRIYIFHFSFVFIDLPTVSVCTVHCTYFAPTVRV